jgi:hypothetical protein
LLKKQHAVETFSLHRVNEAVAAAEEFEFVKMYGHASR